MNTDALALKLCVESFATSASERRQKQKAKVFQKGDLADFTNEITDDWYISSLFDVTHLITCGVAKRPNYVDEGVPFLSAQNARPFKANLNKIKYITKEDYDKLTVGGAPEKNDILYTRVGNCGEAAKVDFDFDFAVYVSLTLIKPVRSLLNSDYLVAFLNSKYGLMQAGQGAIGIGLKNLNVDNVRRFVIPLPPLAEQKVIADKLDELLAEVENTKARLDAIPAILKSFRQSVLAAAVSGKLTEEWREEQVLDAKVDLEMELLFCDSKKRKVEATSSHDIVTSEFSSSWTQSTFDKIYKFIDYRGKTPKKSESGKRLYTAKNIKMGYLSNEPVEYLSDEDYELWMTRGYSKVGDIFFVTEGHTMGCVAMNDVGSDIALAQRTLTLQPFGNVISKFHYYFMLTSAFQKLVDINATGTAAKGIKAAKFRGLPIPFPSYKEQTEIVRRVEELFSFADKVEVQVNAAQVRVNNLTQSILAKAFRGELTADWRKANPELISGDNSAEALLERIKAEREKLKPVKKTRAKKVKAK